MTGRFLLLLVLLLALSTVALMLGGGGPVWGIEGELSGLPLWWLVLRDVRLPRVLVALIVGAQLGVSGAALQGLFKNPLAEPSVLGVSASAALFAQVTLFLGWAGAVAVSLPLAAIAGALLATLVLLSLVGTAKHGALELLVLGGVAVGQVAVALSALLMSMAVKDFTLAQRLLSWLLGSLDGRTWMHVLWGLGPLVVGTAWLACRAKDLDGMTLGDSTALSLGVEVSRVRREVVMATALLSGTAVAVAGVVSFVGLIVPHLLRRLVGTSHALLLPASALGGGVVVVGADLLARVLVAPGELQIGVVTAALGAPWFALLLRKRLREAVA